MTFYGMIKSNSFFYSKQNTVRVAGIANNQIPLLQAMYEDTFGKKIILNEHELTQNSPELAELNRGFAAFIEDPYKPKFERTRAKVSQMRDSLFDLSTKEARSGSKIISWSEAAVIVVKGEEQPLFEKAMNFARNNRIYFLMTVATIIPGKVQFGRKFIENKAILFGPDGNILNVFFKNRPVPMIEPSLAGDGIVPVIETPYGKLAISICYDADFPQLMRQLGSGDADILLLPSGDWKEVSPYHAQMAIVRAIENGTNLLRPVSGAVSIATDFNGKVLAQRNYFDEGEKIVVGYLPVEGVKTVYTIVGDIVAWMCLAALLVISTVVAFNVAKRPAPVISTR
jgi:apolipoprotein N-acyltransferase